MATINKKAYKSLPVSIKVRKPRYYYQDFLEVFNENTTKYITLNEFEGLGYEFNNTVVTFNDAKMWNNTFYTGSTRVLAPYSDEKYLAVVDVPDYNIIGSVVVDDNVVSGFSSSSYIDLSQPFNPSTNTWEVCIKFRTGDTINVWQQLFQSNIGTGSNGRYGIIFYIKDSNVFNFAVAGNSSSWMLDVTGTHTITANTDYWVKFGWNGSEYYADYSLDGENYVNDIRYSSTSGAYGSLIYTHLGIYSTTSFTNPFFGSIDLNETYIILNGDVWWDINKTKNGIFEGYGCLDGIIDVADEKTYSSFVSGSEVLLSESDEDKEGYTWAGNVTIPEHELKSVYTSNIIDENNLPLSIDGNNILVDLSGGGNVYPSEEFYYTFIPDSAFFNYDFRFTTKITPNALSSTQVVAVLDAPNWFGMRDSYYLCIWDVLKSSVAMSNNKTYWIRCGESYNVSTNQYTHRIAFIEDNGYTKETLPDESEWNVTSSTDSTRWFDKSKALQYFNSSVTYSLKGTMDLTNTWFDFGSNGVYETKWKPLEEA